MHRLLISAAIAIAAAVATPASATTFNLDVISTGSIGTGVQGIVTLTQNGADEVDVDVSLTNSATEQFVNTGGPHTPFVFNLDSTVLGTAVITITSTNTPAFVVGPGGESDTPYGAFVNSIDLIAGNGAHGPGGPLDFKVTDASGINISDFIANANDAFFAADLLGTGGGTGAVASEGSIPSTPLPTAWTMMLIGLTGFGFVALRRQRTPSAFAA